MSVETESETLRDLRQGLRKDLSTILGLAGQSRAEMAPLRMLVIGRAFDEETLKKMRLLVDAAMVDAENLNFQVASILRVAQERTDG